MLLFKASIIKLFHALSWIVLNYSNEIYLVNKQSIYSNSVKVEKSVLECIEKLEKIGWICLCHWNSGI